MARYLSDDEFFGASAAPAAPAAPAQPAVPRVMSDEEFFGLPMRQEQPEGPGMLKRAWNYVTGNGRKEDLPELLSVLSAPVPGLPGQATPEMKAQGAMLDKIKNAVMTTPDEQARVDIITKAVPGSTASQDKYGNPTIDYGGQRYYVNRPGASMQDIPDTAAEITKFLPSAAGAGAAGGLLTRMGVGAAASGLTSMAEDALGWLQGSEQPLDKVRAGSAAVGGAGGELLGAGIQKLLKVWRPGLLNPDGTLSRDGANVALKAGVNPKEVTPQVAKQLDQILQNADTSALQNADVATSAMNRANANQFNIPLTRGQASGNSEQIAAEEAMRNMARGQGAYDTMTRFDARQADAVRNAVDNLGGTVGSGRPMPQSAQDVGEVVAQGVRNAETAADQSVRDAYAGLDMKSVRFDATSVGQFARNMARSLRADRIVDKELTPLTAKALDDVNRLAKATDMMAKSRVEPTVSLKQAEVFRRRINLYIDRAKERGNKADVANLMQVKTQVDGFVDNAVDNALLSGDPATVDALKRARAVRTMYGEKFEPRTADADAARVVQRILNTDVNNQEVANWLYGAGEIGSSQSSRRVLDRMSSILGEDSPEWSAIKQGAWARMVWGNKATTVDRMPKGQILSRIDEALNGRGKQITERLFSPEEIAAMRDFRKALELTKTPDGLTNSSKTAYALERVARNLVTGAAGLAGGYASGPIAGMAMQGLAGAASGGAGSRAAQRAITDWLVRPSPMPILGAAGAGLGSQLGGGR